MFGFVTTSLPRHIVSVLFHFFLAAPIVVTYTLMILYCHLIISTSTWNYGSVLGLRHHRHIPWIRYLVPLKVCFK